MTDIFLTGEEPFLVLPRQQIKDYGGLEKIQEMVGIKVVSASEIPYVDQRKLPISWEQRRRILGG